MNKASYAPNSSPKTYIIPKSARMTDALILVDLDTKQNYAPEVKLRFFHTESVTYCHAVIFDGSNTISVYGKAGGYGYHRASAAAEEALKEAGFIFEKPLGGRGESAIREAVKGIADLRGIKNFRLFSI